jgi:hypothetical protein
MWETETGNRTGFIRLRIGTSGRGNDPSGSIQGGELLEQLNDNQLLKTDSAPWSKYRPTETDHDRFLQDPYISPYSAIALSHSTLNNFSDVSELLNNIQIKSVATN